MEITTTQYKNVDVIKMAGRLDSSSAPKLTDAFKKLTDAKRYKIVFDMSEIDFISSAGVWTLMETQKECRKLSRGEVILATVNDKIVKSLDLAGLKHFFTFSDDITEAVGNL